MGKEHNYPHNGCKKQRCTMITAITADGKKVDNAKKDKLVNSVHVHVQGKRWMDATMVCDWGPHSLGSKTWHIVSATISACVE
jgi:hypothetical protein